MFETPLLRLYFCRRVLEKNEWLMYSHSAIEVHKLTVSSVHVYSVNTCFWPQSKTTWQIFTKTRFSRYPWIRHIVTQIFINTTNMYRGFIELCSTSTTDDKDHADPVCAFSPPGNTCLVLVKLVIASLPSVYTDVTLWVSFSRDLVRTDQTG